MSDQKLSRGKYFYLLWIFSNLMIKKNILAFLKSNLESIVIMIAIQGKTAIDKKMGGILKSHTIPVTFEKLASNSSYTM